MEASTSESGQEVRSSSSAFVIPAMSTSASSAPDIPSARARSGSAALGPLVFSLTTRSRTYFLASGTSKVWASRSLR